MYIIERYLSVIYLILNFYHNIFKSESVSLVAGIPISRNRNILLSIPIFIVIFSKAEHAATYALWPFPIFDAENRNILLSYSFYFSTSTAGSVRFTECLFDSQRRRNRVARKFRIPSRRDPRSTRGRSDLSELCVIGQRIRRQHARFRIARQFHAKNSARQRRGHCINIRDVSSILRRPRWP